MNSYFFNVTENEKRAILDKHKGIYNGWTMERSTPKETPLYVEDFAKDKSGYTLTNEEAASHKCPECGYELDENVCSECGYAVEDLNPKAKFDYTETDMNESVVRIKRFMDRLNIL